MGIIIDMIDWLEKWYICNYKNDGLYNHYDIRIFTIDNPGWGISIDLSGSKLENNKFQSVIIDNGENDWYTCQVIDNVFECAGDPTKLKIMIKTFINWVEVT